jgi:hypothetical protein
MPQLVETANCQFLSIRHASCQEAVAESNVHLGISFKLVFDAQAGHVFEVPQIRAEQGCIIDQGDRRDF